MDIELKYLNNIKFTNQKYATPNRNIHENVKNLKKKYIHICIKNDAVKYLKKKIKYCTWV